MKNKSCARCRLNMWRQDNQASDDRLLICLGGHSFRSDLTVASQNDVVYLTQDVARMTSGSSGSLMEQIAAGPSATSCQADGCLADLAKLSTYHQRCRICDEHLKADQFMR